MAEKNYYEILGVAKDADEAEIKKAYRNWCANTTPMSAKNLYAVRTYGRNQPCLRNAFRQRKAGRTTMKCWLILTDAAPEAIRSVKAAIRLAMDLTAAVSAMNVMKASRSERETSILKIFFIIPPIPHSFRATPRPNKRRGSTC